MHEKTIKFGEDTKPPYHGKLKTPSRIADTRDTWYMIINDEQKDGPYTTEDMRGFFEADLFEDDTLCTNEGVDGNYYKLELIFYPNIVDAFLPNEYNPLINLDRRTAAASAEISRLAEKREWSLAADLEIRQLPDTDTYPIEGDAELEWFLHYGNPKWVNKNGETVKIGKSVRRDFIVIGRNETMFEFRKMDPIRFSHKGDGILRFEIHENILGKLTDGMQTTVCVNEMMIFKMCDTVYKLFPVVNGSNRYLITCNDTGAMELIFFTTQPYEVNAELASIYRPIPSYYDLFKMKYRSVSDILGFNTDDLRNIRVFSEKTAEKQSILNVIDNRSDYLNTILTNGKYWILTNWEDDRKINIRFTSDGYITHESDEIIGTWNIKREGSFALYQDNRDWHTIYRQKVWRRVCLDMAGGVKCNMYVLNDTTTSLFYLQEELAYFQMIDGKATMADIIGRKACEAIRVV